MSPQRKRVKRRELGKGGDEREKRGGGREWRGREEEARGDGRGEGI